jgi:hypothetical protein
MPTHLYDSEHDTIAQLEQMGISGKYLYLADIFPLIELLWADGVNQENEQLILFSALRSHVARVNSHAGFELFAEGEAEEFITPFLAEKPSQNCLALLRKLYIHTVDQIHDETRKREVINSFLSYSLDIAASCVTKYPYKNDERFEMPEKECFFSILSDLGIGDIRLA